MKLGGKIMGTPDNILQAAELVYNRKNDHPIVITSSTGESARFRPKFTDRLLYVADTRNFDRRDILDKTIERERRIIRKLGLKTSIINSHVRELRQYFNNPKDFGTHAEYEDTMASYGELMSTKIFSEVLEQMGVPSMAFDTGDFLITDEIFTDANITPEGYKKMGKKLMQTAARYKGVTPVLTGFLGRSKKGKRTTLGRGSSDYVAVASGRAAGVDVEVWKKVPGVLEAHPGYIENPMTIELLSYNEADEMSTYGGVVLMEKSLDAVRSGNCTKIWIKDIDDQKAHGTLITNTGDRSKYGEVKGITCSEVDVLISHPGPDITAEMFQKLRAKDVRIFSASYIDGHLGHTLFIVHDPSHSMANYLFRKTGQKVGGEKNKYMVKLVGDGISRNHEITKKLHNVMDSVQGEFPDTPVFYRVQPITKSSIGIVCRQRAINQTMKLLYNEFFPHEIKEDI